MTITLIPAHQVIIFLAASYLIYRFCGRQGLTWYAGAILAASFAISTAALIQRAIA